MPVLSTLGAAIANVYGFTSGLIKDQYFNLVSLLLPGNGTNGANNNEFLDSGTANSGSGFTITRNGNTTQGTFSPFSQTGWGAYFDGSNDYVSVADNAVFDLSNQNFTIEGWFNPSALPSSGGLYYLAAQLDDSLAATSQAWQLSISNSSGTYTLSADLISGSTGYAVSGTFAFAVGTWYHIAFIRTTSGVTRLFVNGNQVGSDGSANVTVNNSPTAVTIGCRLLSGSPQSGRVFNGYASNFRLTVGAALYTSAFTPSTVPLTTTSQGASASQVELLTLQNNRFVDNSSNEFTVTPNNGAAITPFSPFAPTQSYSAAAVGGSGYFDGNGDTISAPNNAAFDFGSGDFTLEFWFYPTAQGQSGYTALLSKFSSSANYAPFSIVQKPSSYDIALSASSTGSSWNLSNGTTSNFGTMIPNAWNHIAVAREGANCRCFLNGSLNQTSNFSTTALMTNSDPVYIGSGNAANSYGTGYIASLRMVKGTAVYTGGFTPPTKPLASSGADSASAYQSTTNVNTSFASSACSLLLNFTNAGVVDATAKNVLETVGNAQISTTQSKWGGGSMRFPQSGTNDYLYKPYDPLLNQLNGNFTIECWLYPTVTNTRMIFAGSVNSSGVTNWYFEITSANKLRFEWDSTSTFFEAVSSASISQNTWTYVAVVRNGGTITQYINGSADGTASPTGTYKNASYPFAIGRPGDTNNHYFTGYIDDFRMTIGQARTITASPSAPFPVQ